MEIEKEYGHIDTVKLSRIKKIVEAIEKHNPNGVDVDVGFDFIIASLFPRSWDKILDALKDQYTKGYLAGKAE
jgi:hypothetical protein